ncbi:M43 family zinc metalloprotease [Flavobacterium sp. T12S277]|uniref:M43 family zinc metalloprotease n=1 Tax=Flavobacterium sp. T12S277 TaxID=3402752 RepID=UPI003AE5CDA6
MLIIVDGYDKKIYYYVWYGRNEKFYLDIIIVEELIPEQGNQGSGCATLPINLIQNHIIFSYAIIGSTCGSEASATFAKVFTHELGYYFGLNHIF